MALILRNGGSQSPDRWLRDPRNNHIHPGERHRGTFVSHNETSMCGEFLSPINGMGKNLFPIIIMDYKIASEKLPRN